MSLCYGLFRRERHARIREQAIQQFQMVPMSLQCKSWRLVEMSSSFHRDFQAQFVPLLSMKNLVVKCLRTAD